MNTDEQILPPTDPPLLAHRMISGFWRRFFAFLIDSLLLGLVGIVLGIFLFDFFAHLGGWGRVVGFAIALLYFGFFDSKLGHGKTPGKRLMKIEVVDAAGQHVSFERSAVRCAIISVPFFLNGAIIPMNLAVSLVVGFLIFGLGGAIIYLFIFNRRTRQSVHDLVVGTFVVRRGAGGGVAAGPVWRGHLIVAGAWCFLALVGLSAEMPWLARKGSVADLLAVRQKLCAPSNVCFATVNVGRNWTWLNGRSSTTSYFQSSVVLKLRPKDFEKMADAAAATVLANYPRIGKEDVLSVTVVYGYDIGIAQSWTRYTCSYSPQEWRQILGKAGGRTPSAPARSTHSI